MNPAIVINAYNRPQALARLLDALCEATYPQKEVVPLVISIDRPGSTGRIHPETLAAAQGYDWPYGPKEIIPQPEHLGLVKHFLACGDLTQRYGSIIYLEDDLLISPVFYFYASQMLDFYQTDERIAGISLYGLWFNGYNQFPFVPYLDTSDIFFVQAPYTQGEAFTREQWAGFRAWQAGSRTESGLKFPFHESWGRFDAEDWFPAYARYMASNGRFFVFPRASLSTGAGDAGTHFASQTGFFQVPMQQEKLIYRPKPLDDSLAVYDSFFEILPSRLNRMTSIFQSYDYCLDLYALRSKANIQTEYVVTSRPCKQPIYTFGKSMWPMEANIIHGQPGKGISFCRAEDLQWGWRADTLSREGNRFYFSRGRIPGFRSITRSKLARWMMGEV